MYACTIACYISSTFLIIIIIIIIIISFFQIVLVVNVASECGYTDYNYRKLNQLQLRYGEEFLVILAFPCNQFGAQEPAKDSEIDSMIRYKYNPRFPLFSKVNVTGETQSEVYRFLINSTNGLEPKWNFCKYLLDRDGLVVQFFDQGKTFDKIYESIDELLYRKRREL